MTTTLENGSVAVPRDLLEELGLADGARLEVHREGDRLVLVPAPDAVANVETYLESLAGAWLEDGGDNQGLERLIDARRENRARADLHSAQTFLSFKSSLERCHTGEGSVRDL